MNQQEQMYLLVEQWRQSDLTKANFTASKSLSYHQFNYWLKKFNKQEQRLDSNSEVSFFSVAQTPTKEKTQPMRKSTDQKSLRIDLPSGITITIY